MRLFLSTLTFCIVISCFHPLHAQERVKPVLVIHGGAGTIERNLLSDSAETAIRDALSEALRTGYSILESGGTSADAVVATIQVLEDSPYFNAGRGAVMTNIGTHELDASIMNGYNLNAGAVAGVKTIKSPIAAAREVMTGSPHVMLSGEGAEAFAKSKGLDTVPNTYFTTPRIRQRWLESHGSGSASPVPRVSKYGTVGCVALDMNGNIAAGTSTGGLMNKEFGRIGDSPIIGAGTYADNSTCGISCTGQGEFFIRIGVAKEISDQMKFGGKTLAEAAAYTVDERLGKMNALGGIIALDGTGHIEMRFNTPGMYRGYKNGDEEKVMIYGDE